MKIDLTQIIRSQLGNSITAVPCSIDLAELLEFNNLHVIDIEIDELLALSRQVAVIWSTEDVQEVRPDLNDDQSWKVLQRCQQRHDCNDGFNWDSIEQVSSELFPSSDEGDDQ